MRGVVRTVIGMAMIAAGVLLAAWALYELLRIGTCASGGPYVSARECPPGTGTKILSIFAAVFLMLIGAAVTPGVAIAGVTWGLGFTLAGVGFFVAAFGPAAPPEADSSLQWVGGLVGGMFLLMGTPGFFAIFGARRGGGGRAQRLLEHGKRCQGTVLSVQDTGMTINENPRVKMRVKAEPPGEPAFEFEKTATVSRVQIPRAGDRCAVFYDPAGGEPGISFDAPALAMVGLMPGAGAPTAAAVPGVVTVSAPPSPPSASAPAGADDDTVAELERLARLRASGALTEEEFQQAKARILGAPPENP